MRISVITVCFNAASTLKDAVESVLGQVPDAKAPFDLEYIVVDGGSTDGTLELLAPYRERIATLISEPDQGLYDAMNKGVQAATGDVVAILNADDVYASTDVLARVAATFRDSGAEAVYGDLHYVDAEDLGKVTRRWRAGDFSRGAFRRGWMPPHPTLYLRRSVLEAHGSFDCSYPIAADYEAILRYFGSPGFKAAYIPRVLVKMRVGGESNQSLRKILRKSYENYRALRASGIGGFGALAWKNLSKLGQFVRKG